MLKRQIKNYLNGLQRFLVPMGAMFVGLLIGLSVALPIISGAMNTLIDGVKELVPDNKLDFNQLFQSFWDSVKALDWSNPLQALSAVCSLNWLEDALGKSLEALLGVDFQSISQQLGALWKSCLRSVKSGIVLIAVFFALGVVGGYVATAAAPRRGNARGTWWKKLLFHLAEFAMLLVLLIVGLKLYRLWKYSAIIYFFVAIALLALTSFFGAYLVYGYKRVAAKQALTLKNVGNYLYPVLVSWLANLTACILLSLVLNKLVVIVLCVALVEVTLPANNLTAQQFVETME